MGYYGTYDDQPAWIDQNPDGTTNIFPGGHPSRGPHDHIVFNRDGGVTYMRENDRIINRYRDQLPDGSYYNG